MKQPPQQSKPKPHTGPVYKTPPARWAFRYFDRFRDYTQGCSQDGCRGAEMDESLPWCPLHQAAIDKGEYNMADPEVAIYTYMMRQFKQVHRFTIYTTPMGAPRMVRSDAWKDRECVVNYRTFKEVTRKACGPVLLDVKHVWCQSFLPMPAGSWSKKKLDQMDDAGHRQRPDADNLIKALLDSIFENDSGIYGVTCFKLWCPEGQQRLEVGLFA